MKNIAFIVLTISILVSCGGGGTGGETPTGLLEEEPQIESTSRYVGYWPAMNPRAIVIIVAGHDGWDAPYCPMTPIAEMLQDLDFDVHGFRMPPGPHGPPIEDFYLPIVQFIESLPPDLPVFIFGLSGGGMTTLFTTAYCPRIKKGYSVAGYLPLDLRTWPGDIGDWEQRNPPKDYRTLQDMARGRFLPIFHDSDSCCFGYLDQYGKPRWTEQMLGIPFIHSSDNGGKHIISNGELTYIVSDIIGILKLM